MHIEYRVIGKIPYYFLVNNGIQIGKCIIIKENTDTIILKYISIYENYRGNNYSTQFWNLLENEFRLQNIKYITMEARELNEKYNKLYNLYTSWGFKINGNIRYTNNGEEVERVIPMIKEL